MTPEEFSARLAELESRLAFQDDTLRTLNDVVARQQTEIATLHRHLRDLAETLADLRSGAAGQGLGSDPHEPPPHY